MRQLTVHMVDGSTAEIERPVGRCAIDLFNAGGCAACQCHQCPIRDECDNMDRTEVAKIEEN